MIGPILVLVLVPPSTFHPTNTPRGFHVERRGNGRFHVISTWNPRGVFVGIVNALQQTSKY